MEESDDQTGNVSDTESNMGGHKYNFEESLRNTNPTTESIVTEERGDSDDVSSSGFQNAKKKLQKQKNRSESKRHIKSTHLSKKVSLTKAVKNKGNQDLFGAQGSHKFLNKIDVSITGNDLIILGNYTIKNTELHSQDDAVQQQQEIEQCETQLEAFITTAAKSKKSFRNEKRQHQQQRKSNAAVTVNSANNTDVLEIRSLNSKRAKSKNPIVLKNFQSLRDTAANDSNETDI